MDERGRRHALIIHGFSALAYLYTLAAVVLYWRFEPEPILVFVHGAAFALVLANQLAFLRHGRIDVAQNVFASVGVLTIIPVFITGGFGGAGVVWSFAYLIFAFTLTGALMGLVWAGALGAGAAIVLATMRAMGQPLPYSAAFLIDASWAYALSLGLLFIFTRAYEASQRRVEEKAAQDREIDALRRTDALRNAMLSTVSHELKTPLTPLLLQARLLSNPAAGPLTERQRKAVTIIERNLGRLSALVNQTLDVSRLQAGRMSLERKETPLAPLLREAVEAFGEAAARQEVALVADEIDDTVAWIDADRVTQVVYNLVSNALKFTQPGGRVAIRARSHDGVAHVEVADTGFGVAPEQTALLFTPFGRLEHAAAAKTEGTGMGLFISKGIVEAHGGTIVCRSAGLGRGTTFAFTLPLGRETREDAGSSPRDDRSSSASG